MSAHTKGPWVADGFDVEAGLTTICTTYPWSPSIDPYGVDNNEIAQANARLIAAAPELLEALTKIEEALRKDAEPPVIVGDSKQYRIDGQSMYHAINLARAAIAKVRNGGA